MTVRAARKTRTPSPAPVVIAGFGRRENQGAGFLLILKQLETQARGLTTPPSEGMLEAIHQTRLVIKRLRALLWLAGPALPARKLAPVKAQLREAAHLLAAQRDLVVTQKLLEELSRKKSLLVSAPLPLPPSTGKSLAPAFGQAAALLAKSLLETALQVKAVTSWPDSSIRVREAFRATRKAGKKALKSDQTARFHIWRKKAKRLLYLLQWTQSAPDQPMVRLLKRVDSLQQKLGLYHDCVVAQEYLQKYPDEFTPAIVRKGIKRLEKKKSRLRETVEKVSGHLN